MSISSRGVKIQKHGRNYWLLIILTFVELVFSVLLIVSLASNLLFPQRVSAVAGVSAKLSYQGRLTDLSGNPLGGTGTNYCFRFSIYDAASVGTKVWPAGVPASTTVRVKDGVFNTELGTADSIATFDFSANDTIYLNVEVNATATTCGGAWEQLDLRQRIDSVGYARSAEGVYSSLLRAPTGGTAVQIGTGAGAATPIFFNLDVQNTDGTAVDGSCSTNGQIWYNSFDSRARVCQGSVIRDMIDGLLVKDEGTNQGRASTALDFTGAGVVASKGAGGVININVPFGGIAVNAASTVSSGVVVFSNSNNVTFGILGSVITASITAAGGGGGGATVSHWPPFMIGLATSSNYTGATAAGTNITASFHVAPLQLPAALSFSRINILASYVTTIAGTGSVSLAHMLGIYTLNAGTALSLSTSYMFRQEISQNSITAGTYRWYWGTNSTSNSSSISGNVGSLFNSLRNIPLYQNAGGSLSAGQYYMVYAQTNRSSSVDVKPAATIMFVSGSQSNLIGNQLGSVTTNTPFPLLGYFSSTTTAGNFTTPFMPSSINTTVISYSTSQLKWPFVNFQGK